MPVRHDDDFRRKYIKSWESWVDEAIREAEERGDFDDLPDKGKRIQIEETPFAPEMSSALRTLKNAGYQPTWMELDKEITRDKRELDAFLDRSCEYLRAQVDELRGPRSTEVEPGLEEPGLWTRIREWLLHGDGGVPAIKRHGSLTSEDLIHMRARMREQYLDRAAAIDKKIGSFHATLPRNLWHLERMRLTQDAASKAFDDHCPRVV